MAASSNYLIRILVLVSCVLISACSKTILLKPSLLGQDCKSDYWNNAWACGTPCLGLPTMGEACVNVNGNSIDTWLKNEIAVGWQDRYKPGTNPCPCWESASNMSHGYVKFDVSPLKGKEILSASLAWNKSTISSGEGTVATNIPKHVSCVRFLLEATGPWKLDATPGKILYND